MTSVTSKRRMTSCLFSTTAVVLLFSFALSAQGNFGRILGSVKDSTGAVIPGATVSIIDKDRGLARTLTTDEAGLYNAPNLIPGTYTVRAELPGFKRLDRENVVVEVGSEIRVDVTIEPGQQGETVTVSEAIPLVDTTSGTLGGILENAAINNMPSPFTDGATILPIDAIQEFHLEENPKAEYGWKTGAIVNVGIRSGTNSYHGSGYAFGRSDAWAARNYFNPVGPKQPTELKQFGGVVGGPIMKDRLFFFGGYEGLRSFVGNALGMLVPATGALGGDPLHSMVDALNVLQARG